MKQTLLFSFLIMFFITGYGQAGFVTLAGPQKDLAVEQPRVHPDQVAVAGSPLIGQKNFGNTIIGPNWYDLQSYTNVMQRIWAYPDGTIGASWMSAGENLVPERGAGYNYYDGANWGTPNPHVGPADRMGWPSYAPWGPNGEIISLYRYVAGSGPIKFYKRANKGTGDWIETSLSNPNNVALVWHSMMTSGENHEYIHLLAFTYDNPYNGQTNALLYYRSSDGAETWDIDGVVIDGLGPEYYPGISSLAYAWANPVGETIAFTYGFNEFGGKIFKSYDNGDNWEVTDVFESPIDPFNVPTDSDRIPCGMGTSAIALDSQGNAHVVFTRMAKIWTEGTQYFYPFTDGLIYWREGMPVLDTTIISSYTLDYLYEAGNLCGWVLGSGTLVIPEGQPNYNNGMCAYPQISIDAEDNIFVAASNIAPGYDNGTYIYRHIVVSSSFDGGQNWNEPVDINDDILYIFSECAYPAMAPVIGDDLHLVFQEDPLPGINQWLTNHDPNENNMMYMTIPKDFFVGVKEKPAAASAGFTVFPNPSTGMVYLRLNLKEASPVTVRLFHQTGQLILEKEMGNYAAGHHQVELNLLTLAPGVYFGQVAAGNDLLTQRIIIQ